MQSTKHDNMMIPDPTVVSKASGKRVNNKAEDKQIENKVERSRNGFER